ncbi:MAG: hypothetical protein A2X49_01930 [Lentisphaerae bacterium GWF2_52_8]|nr:MAG: hypothetical protein A2X49_01930 [Lentisphaerae bacterium GWF2_52_8]
MGMLKRVIWACWPWCLVCLMLGLHALLAWSGARSNSPTFDEAMHFAGGVSYWRCKDYRINPESGVFPQKWAALPVAFQDRISFPPLKDDVSFKRGHWSTANEFLFQPGCDPDELLRNGRAMILLLSMTLGLAVFLASRQLWGLPGAFISLALYILCPSICANGALVTADIAVSLGFFLAVWAFWALCREISILRIILFGAALGLLLVSKMSGVILAQVLLILLLVRLKPALDLPLKCGRIVLQLKGRGRILLALIGASAFAGLVAFPLIWSAYGFRYGILHSEQGQARIQMDEGWDVMTKKIGLIGQGIGLVKKAHLLPEAYLYGLAYTFYSTKSRPAFMAGEYSNKGWFSFFPYCFLVKTPIPILFFLLLGLWAALKRWSFPDVKSEEKLALIGKDFLRLAPWLVFILCYGLFAVSSSINIGFRHILPCLPMLYVLCGAAAYLLRDQRQRKLFGGLIVLLLAWLLWENLSIRPHYLAYFNQLAGGPQNGYWQLADSSLDWGQDLRNLEQWLVENKLLTQKDTHVYVSYFGSAPLANYGLESAFHLPSYFRQDKPELFNLRGGVYCISATMLQMVYCARAAHWDAEIERKLQYMGIAMRDFVSSAGGPEEFAKKLESDPKSGEAKACREWELMRFGKLCSMLRTREPDAMIGYSILIYRLSDDDVSKALQPWPEERLNP